MLSTILLIVACVVGALSILYMLARLFSPLVGESLAFPMIVIFRPAVALQKMLERCADFCNGIVEKSLRYPPQVAGDMWDGVGAIARNIIFLVSSNILTGDMFLTVQRSPILFGGDG